MGRGPPAAASAVATLRLALGTRLGDRAALVAYVYRRSAEVRTPPVLDADPPGPFALPAVDQETVLDRRRLSLTSIWELADRLSFLVSGELRHEDGESDAVIAGELPADFALERTTRSAARPTCSGRRTPSPAACC